MEINDEIDSLKSERCALLNVALEDPDAVMKSRLVVVKEQLNEINDFLQDKRQLLKSLDEITQILEAILIQNRKIKLITLSNLPIEPLVGVVKPENKTDAFVPVASETTEQIYKHGVEIIIQGGYFDLLVYLGELEKMPVRMFWDNVSLRVDELQPQYWYSLFTP